MLINNFGIQVGIAWTLLTTVLFVFPPEQPVTGTNMNYAIVAFGVVLVIAIVQWIIDGRKNYEGPIIDAETFGLGQDVVEGVSGAESKPSGDESIESKAVDA
jgi:choline transport protein